MAHRHGATVAAFLQQAEENLAILSARTRSEGVPWPDFQAQPFRSAPSGYVAVGASPVAEAKAGTWAHQGQTPRRDTENLSPRSPHSVADDAGLSPRLLDGMARRCAGSRAELDDAFRRLEDKEAEAKEQMDVQAKMMLGLDRKVKAFDSRIRAVEAGMAAAADIATAGRSTAEAVKTLDVRLSEVESTIISFNPVSDKTALEAAETVENRCGELERRFESLAATLASAPRKGDASGVNGSQQLADLQRRAAALAEGARRDREASRQHTKGLVDELKKNVRHQLDDFDRRLRAREERLSEETRQQAGEVGRQLAGELLSGPVADLVERRAQRTEEAMAETARAVHSEQGVGLQRDVASWMEAAEEKLQSVRQAAEAQLAEIAQQAVSHAMTEVTWENIQETAQHSAREAAAEIAVQAVAGVSRERSAHKEQSDVCAPGSLLLRTAERVAELEARGQGEEQAYWETVQTLDARVAGLEEEISRINPNTSSELAERVAAREAETPQIRRRRSPDGHRGGVTQDAVALSSYERRHGFTNGSPRKDDNGAASSCERRRVLANSSPRRTDSSSLARIRGQHEDPGDTHELDAGLIISPRGLSNVLNTNSVSRHDRGGLIAYWSGDAETCDRWETPGAMRPPRLPLNHDDRPAGDAEHRQQFRRSGELNGHDAEDLEAATKHEDPRSLPSGGAGVQKRGDNRAGDDARSECCFSDRSERSDRSRASQHSRQSRQSRQSQRGHSGQRDDPGASMSGASERGSNAPVHQHQQETQGALAGQGLYVDSLRARESGTLLQPAAPPTPPRSPAPSLPRTPPQELSATTSTLGSIRKAGSSHHGSSQHGSSHRGSRASSDAGDAESSAPWDEILKSHQWEASIPASSRPSSVNGHRGAAPDEVFDDEDEEYFEEGESESGNASLPITPASSAARSQNKAPRAHHGGHHAAAGAVHYGPPISNASSQVASEVGDFDDDEELPI